MVNTWLPAITDIPDLIGIILLFFPYVVILLPFLQGIIVKGLQQAYLHRTPRDDWNLAVDRHPPRRFMGYFLSILFTFTSICLLLWNHYEHHQDKNKQIAYYLIDIGQYFIYISLPLIIAILRPPSRQPCDFSDISIILLILIPIEVSQDYDPFLPDVEVVLYHPWNGSPVISLLQLTSFNLLLFIFFIFRPLSDIGLDWGSAYMKSCKRFTWVSLRLITVLVLFLFIAIPFCLIPSIDFLHPSQKMDNVWRDGVGRYFCLFFLEILVGEFLYRGILQNLMHSYLDYRHDSDRFLAGGDDSLFSTLTRVDKNGSLNPDNNKEIELFHSSKRHENKTVEDMREALLSIDLEDDEAFEIRYKYSGMSKISDADTLMTTSHKESRWSSLLAARNTLQCSAGVCFCLRLDRAKDWLVIVFTSLIYAVTIVDYRNFEETQDLVYAMLWMFWFGFCCGWLYRMTHSCLISAILNSLIIYNFKYVFNPTTEFCNGAC